MRIGPPIRGGVAAFGASFWATLRAPWLVVALYVVTLLATAPFAIVLGQQLRADIQTSHPEGEVPDDIDADWWVEYRRHATGLASTFTPNVIGFAAPLDHLSALLDAAPRSWMIAGPVALYALMSAWFWGGLLHRFHRRRAVGWRAFSAAARQGFWLVLSVNLIAAVAVLTMSFAAYLVLSNAAFDVSSTGAPPATTVLAWRVAVYLVFGSVLLGISVVADYARIAAVCGQVRSLPAIGRTAVTLIRQRLGAVFVVVVLTALCLVALLVGYGAIDLRGGSGVGGWRAVAVGQAYILGRLALRVANAGAQVRVATHSVSDAI